LKFAYLPDKNGEWFEFHEKSMRLRNFNHGGFQIDENADYWLTAEIYEYESWHELYTATDYCPLKHGQLTYWSAWLDSDGEIWYADSHGVDAVKLANYLYGFECDLIDWDEAELYLYNKNWIKVTRGPMWEYYCKDTKIWTMTSKTFDTLVAYCNMNNLRMPKIENIRIVE